MKKIRDLDKIIKADYTAIYLTKTKKILETNNIKNKTILRYCHFEKEPIYVCGISHCVQILKQIKGNFKVYGVKDGDLVEAGQPILVIVGDYTKVAETESVLDGILARESSVCNKVKRILTIIKPSKLIYMADRADLYLTQPYDGYAAYVGGARTFTSKAQVELIDGKNVKVVGTVPHALIQQHNGNLSKALKSYHKTFPKEKLSALVDYHNDVVNEIKNIDEGLRKDIVSIRIDTSKSMCDRSLKGFFKSNGVSTALVFNARKTLDRYGMKHAKIIVSSGFDEEKIRKFESCNIKPDFYGVGGSLVKVDVNITCDLVYLNGKPEAKAGRNLGIDLKSIKKLNIYI